MSSQASLAMLSSAFNQQKLMQQKLLLNPAISGFTTEQLGQKLNFAFGGGGSMLGAMDNIGGVSLGDLNLYGFGGLNDLNVLGQGESIFDIGMRLGGPNSLAASLHKKAQVAAIEQGQQTITSLATQRLQLQQMAYLKRARGMNPVLEMLQLQELSIKMQQAYLMQQQGMLGMFGRSLTGSFSTSNILGAAGIGASSPMTSGIFGGNVLGGLGQTMNPLSQVWGGMGAGTGFGGIPVGMGGGINPYGGFGYGQQFPGYGYGSQMGYGYGQRPQYFYPGR